ncbi:hypothetical protein KAR91_12560 [Candidatus Pacearchaeota archaeon]|nr:hypothetical protein [Candidatus Pacearchaeota archaeon]
MNSRDEGQHIAEQPVENVEKIECAESDKNHSISIAEAKDNFNLGSIFCKYCNKLCQK